MNLSKAKLVKTIYGQNFLLTGTRLYQPYGDRGRNARKPWRFVSLPRVKSALQEAGLVRTSYAAGRQTEGFYSVQDDGNFLSIGCKIFDGKSRAAIRKAARL